MEAVDTLPATATFRAMGSDAVVVIDGAEFHVEAAKRRIAELERLWSRFIPDSEISMMNRSPEWVRISQDTLTLLDRSFAAWEMTSGAFDPTILPSLVAGGYAQSRSEIPGRTVLSQPSHRGPAPGPKVIDIDRTSMRVRLPQDAGFDPGGIGKGLAADLVAEEAVASGAAAAIISIGGDVRVAGVAPPDWVVAVEDPMDQDALITELWLESGGVCTSSVLAKTWEHDGHSVHHLIDPGTGNSIASDIVSATVVAGESWVAEALCKTAITASPVSALSFLESAGVDGVLVDVNDMVWRTSGIERFTA